MKIALNATCFNSRPSGAKQRFLGIYGNLIRRMPESEFIVFEPADCRMVSWFNGAPNVQFRATPIPSHGRLQKFLYAYCFWHRILSVEKFDFFEGFHLPLPKAPNSKTILTIHDTRRLQPEWGWFGRIAFSKALKYSLRHADVVVTVSDSIKQELLPHCSGTPIYVIPNGLDFKSHANGPTDYDLHTFRKKNLLPKHFLLAVGHLERRKNYPKLIEAIALLRSEGRDCHLLIIGNDSGDRSLLEDQIDSYKLKDSITLLSGISDLDVRCAYELCSLFVFPSTYEGFGIPILEAMASGRPMVLSDIPVFREITENRSVYFIPDDSEDMASAIKRILDSGYEQTRLVDYGRMRAQAFDFSNIGLQYQQLYESLLS